MAALWLEHGTGIELPTPTGSFAVGRTMDAWTDNLHSDPLAPVPGTKRELLAWIWYPAATRQPVQATNDYLPDRWRTAVELSWGVTRFLSRDLSRVRSHSVRDAELSPAQRFYPMVLIRAGLADLTTDYTTLADYDYIAVARKV